VVPPSVGKMRAEAASSDRAPLQSTYLGGEVVDTDDSGEETRTDEEGSDFSDDDDDDVDDFKGRGRCYPVCTAKCCCHICYVVQFCIYIVVFPLWCKYLVTAPMPYDYWNEDFPPFPLIKPLSKTDVALKAQASPQVKISPIPRSESACNYSCSKELRGYTTDEMNFPVRLTLNNDQLVTENAHTLFPVLLTSGDFKHWMVAADRRNSKPEPFFRARSASAGQGYEMVTDSCTKDPPVSFGLEHTYILACVTWSPESLKKLKASNEDGVNSTDLGRLCDSVGGVCGWPCGTFVPSDRLPACSADGNIDVNLFKRGWVPDGKFAGQVKIEACQSNNPKKPCHTMTSTFSQWSCHHCMGPASSAEDDEKDKDKDKDEDELPGLGPGGLPSLPGIAGPGGAPPPLHRRLRAVPLDDIEVEAESRRLFDLDEDQQVIYRSLPRMSVSLREAEVPDGTDVLTTPRVFVLSAASLDGPWKKLYAEKDPSEPDDTELPTPILPKSEDDDEEDNPRDDEDAIMDPDIKHSMTISNLNELEMHPTSCYGRRGPLYIVACAVNVSTYTDGGKFKRFMPGQEVAPPPFNDRCLAVTGRCGQACMHDQQPMMYCNEDGYIDQKHLVGEIKVQDNKQLPVYMFVYVLLFGFCVKVIMLCPGIFSPYPHYSRYDPKLTKSLKYIVTCTPTTAGDENKSTTIRNVVGCISAMPRRIQCRYHVVMLDETHRSEMKVCFQRLGDVVSAIPAAGGASYQDNVTDFFGAWCEETKKLDLNRIGGRVKQLDKAIMDRVCGKAAYRKMCKEYSWAALPQQSLRRLEQALDAFEADIANDNKWTRQAMHMDDILDWTPSDRTCMLRMHYVARAKPIEDERTNRVQHVAPGTWYYKAPISGLKNSDWLELRKTAKEMVYGREDPAPFEHLVPLRTSRGKAGGLNFVDNYMVQVSERPENRYVGDREEQNYAPSLFSIADARHQFQHDFMASTIPYFFHPSNALNKHVAFTQCPQHFHESQDKTDYLDTNNASFFRLNCMIRNCSGGVSSCGTNGTWMIDHRKDPDPNGMEPSTIWETQRSRVRDKYSHQKIFEMVERRTFHESCKVEDTASSLQAVVQGKYSQFINRKLSYGMAKAAVGYLAATQRWAEGGVVLSLQTLTSIEEGHWMVFATLVFFGLFIFSLIRLVSMEENAEWVVVKMHLVSKEFTDWLLTPVFQSLDWFVRLLWEGNLLGTGLKDPTVYTHMAVQMIMWLMMLCILLFFLWVLTVLCKAMRIRRYFLFPDQLRWCGRLLISMDNLTYFVWFWTAFFWIGFNYYTAMTRSHYHFQFEGMMLFMAVVNFLNWGMIISNAFRYSLEQSMEANEVAHLSMDNIWRSNQLFYMTAPVQLFSIIVGIKEFLRWKFYGMDISFWEGGDRGEAAIRIVKYWTLLLTVGPVIAWSCYFIFANKYMNAWAACVVVTIIGLDVLHPCAYLWVGDSKLTNEEAQKMTWRQALTSSKWWKRRIYNAVLNDTLTGILKYVGPAYFLLLPVTCLTTTYFGVNGAFMMVAATQQR